MLNRVVCTYTPSLPSVNVLNDSNVGAQVYQNENQNQMGMEMN